MALDLEFRNGSREPYPLDYRPPKPGKPVARKTAEQEEQDCLSQLESWYAEQVDAHVENRSEQLLDCDYYDHHQIDEATRRTLEARNQAPLQFDLTHAVIDWIAGTERRTRVDWKVHPRGPEDQEGAEAKTELLKWIGDVNQAAFERSEAFKDAIKCGVGWFREFVPQNPEDPPIVIQRVDWKAVRWDAFDRTYNLRRCRSLNIDRWLDLDYAMAMFPRKASELRDASRQCIDGALEYVEDDLLMPQLFHGTFKQGVTIGGSLRRTAGRRSRVKVVETEYRRVVTEQRIRAMTHDFAELSGILFDPTDSHQLDLLNHRKIITLDDRPVERMWTAIWVPGTRIMCSHVARPYRHQKFSLTPIWCYRRDRDGMPYGVMRGLRDPQDEYNKRRSKTLFMLSTAQVQYEEDALANGVDEEDFLAEVAKPNGQLKLASGAIAGQKVKIGTNTEVTAGHIQLMEQAARHVFEASGVTRENLGLDSDAKSGKAILAKQQQGAVGTAEIFDNFRRSIQTSGEKTLSLAEQYVSQPMQLRILGQNGVEFLGINQPEFDPVSGQVLFKNDILASQADFVVDQQDYRETIRMAMAEMLLETISKLPPELGIQLLDLAIDLTDLPNRNELVARIRKLNGVGQPPAPPDPNAAAQQAAADAIAQLEQQAAQAKARKDDATAEKLRAEAQAIRVRTKSEAMDLSGLLEVVPHRAPAADRLAAYPPPIGTGQGAGMES